MKAFVYLIGALGAVLVAACSPGAPASPPVTRDRSKLPGVLAYEQNLPSLVAVARDYFGEENIEIESFVLGSGSTLRSAVMSKEYDFGLFAFVHVPLARQANSPLRMVAATHDREAFSLIVRRELREEVHGVADLRGKRIGFTTPGSGSWALANAYLRQVGLDPERDVDLVSLGGDAAVIYTALQTGKVDAVASWEPITSRALTSNIAYPVVSIWEPEQHRQWLGADNVVGFGLVTRDDVIQAKPDLVRRMVAAHVKGLDFIREHSAAEIADAVLGHPLTSQQFEGLDRSLVIQILERIKPGFGTGCLSRHGFQVEMDLAVQSQIVKSPVAFDDFADTTWAGECA